MGGKGTEVTSNYPRLVALWSPARKTVQLQMTPLTGAACLTTRRRKGEQPRQGSPLMDRPATGRLPCSFLTPCVRTCNPRGKLAQEFHLVLRCLRVCRRCNSVLDCRYVTWVLIIKVDNGYIVAAKSVATIWCSLYHLHIN